MGARDCMDVEATTGRGRSDSGMQVMDISKVSLGDDWFKLQAPLTLEILRSTKSRTTVFKDRSYSIDQLIREIQEGSELGQELVRQHIAVELTVSIRELRASSGLARLLIEQDENKRRFGKGSDA